MAGYVLVRPQVQVASVRSQRLSRPIAQRVGCPTRTNCVTGTSAKRTICASDVVYPESHPFRTPMECHELCPDHPILGIPKTTVASRATRHQHCCIWSLIGIRNFHKTPGNGRVTHWQIL